MSLPMRVCFSTTSRLRLGSRSATQIVTPPSHNATAPSFKFPGDGSFSYTPAPGFSGTDFFTYNYIQQDEQISNTARVEIYVSPATTPATFIAGGPSMSMDTASGWPKFHKDIENTGSTLGLADPGGTVAFTASNFVQPASPVLGHGLGPEVFVPDARGLTALSAGAGGGSIVWGPTSTTGGIVGTPLAVTTGGPDTVVVGSHTLNNLYAISTTSGAVTGTFVPQESFTGSFGTITTTLGAIDSSPTLMPAIGSNPPAIVFGTDGTQNHGESSGRLYALRADGTVLWMTLLASKIHGCPAITPPSATSADGFVYVGTYANPWTGVPGITSSMDGRFYQLDTVTGQVFAEDFTPQNITTSATIAPDISSGSPDFNSAGATVIYTSSTDGDVYGVSPILAPPAPDFETPTLTPVYSFQGQNNPTSPALSPDFLTVPPIAYVGDNAGLRAFDAGTGVQEWYFTPPNGIAQTVTAAPLTLETTARGVTHVIFGTVVLGNGLGRRPE